MDKFLAMLKSKEPLAYDVETNGLKWQSQHTIGYSLSDGVEKVYVPVRHTPGGNIEQVDDFEREVARLISERKAPLITHNGKFDSHFSLNHGIRLADCGLFDTMVGAALLNENAGSFSLKSVAKKLGDIPQKQDEELYTHMVQKLGPQHKRNYMGNYHLLRGDDPIACEYAEYDTLTTWHVWNKQRKEIYGENLDFVYDLELRLLHVLQKMERRGVCIDMDEVERMRSNIDQLQLDAHAMLPLKEDLNPINTRSNKDLQDYFTMHEITDWEFTEPTERHPNGLPSFNKLFLGQSDAGKILLQARAIDHFKNSFVDPIDAYIFDGKLFTNFNQTFQEFGGGTKSGRLSCNHPNMQQVPKRDKFLGAIFRKIFIPKPGFTFIEFDYSQAEPRLFSHYSDEPVLVHGYNQVPFIDMHTVAANYMHIERGQAKNLNLGLQYTMGIAKLAKQLGIDESEARAMYYKWKATFPNVSKFTKRASQVAEDRGYVKTILGRRARFPDPRWAYRAANRIVQGGSADILKYAMVKLDDWIVGSGQEDKVRMLLNIHDAILFEVEDSILEETIPKIKAIMENVQSAPFNLRVPFIAEYKTGKNWADATY